MKINSKKKYIAISLILGLTLLVFVSALIGPYLIIKFRYSSSISENIDDVQEFEAALLLGTNPRLANGWKNAYFYNRIDAAENLYKSGKIKYIIVSGDNSNKSYNEPEEMKNELTSRGIPAKFIYCDYAGFRTLDSVIRVKEIFGQNKILIISQKFHCERAVFIARVHGIEAYGYCAKDVNKYYGFKTNLREIFARSKVFVDIVFGVEPKFYGEKIILN